jgi:hypothetical protein
MNAQQNKKEITTQPTEIPNPKPFIPSKKAKQKDMLRKQLKLVKNQQVRALPGKTYLSK